MLSMMKRGAAAGVKYLELEEAAHAALKHTRAFARRRNLQVFIAVCNTLFRTGKRTVAIFAIGVLFGLMWVRSHFVDDVVYWYQEATDGGWNRDRHGVEMASSNGDFALYSFDLFCRWGLGRIGTPNRVQLRDVDHAFYGIRRDGEISLRDESFGLRGECWRHPHVFIHLPYWPFVAGAFLLATLRVWRQLERSRKGRCENCGYDLRATPGLCPECGTVSTTTIT